MAKRRVAVVFGGRSVEHDVSIVTAHQVMAVLATRHEVIPVYVTREGEWLTGPGLHDLGVYKDKRWGEVGEPVTLSLSGERALLVPGGRLKGLRRIPVDVAVPAIHGTFGEDGTLQGLLELADIPYVGSGVSGSAVGMDKVAMKAVFDAAGLPTVPHVLVEVPRYLSGRDAVLEEIEGHIGYPAFVKPSRLGSSVGIGKAKDRDGLIEALEVARRYDRRILVERSMEGCIEINCSVLGGYDHPLEASVCEQPLGAEEYLSFADKYMSGTKTGSKTGDGMAAQDRRIPAPISDALTKEVQSNALRAFRAVDAAGVARVDSFVKPDTGETWVMEINTVPGSFSFYLWEATGVTFDALLERLLGIAASAHAARSELMFSFDSALLESGSFGSK
ncbi:MAG: D-alanine-D-alanine ligase [Actinomycetota bacterium]|jgi:D-alanine-D-alanine ligase|nr:D-alanine-D-alanine ligase [Actinomycetota bacterium]